MKYGSKVKSSNIKDVANMFNQYFFDKLSDPSKYDTEIDFLMILFVTYEGQAKMQLINLFIYKYNIH